MFEVPLMQLRPHQQRALDALASHTKGQVIIPTGGGKTLVAIKDAQRQIEKGYNQTIVVVAPRILLAHQLCAEFLEHIIDAKVMHVHSGRTHHFSTTKSYEIKTWVENNDGAKLIFTTYHSLHRLQESDILVNAIYFDEAHNSVARNFLPAVEFYSTVGYASCYFFTATPKHSGTKSRIGMENKEVFGEVIFEVPAPELVREGYILPPKVVINKYEKLGKYDITPEVESAKIIDSMDKNAKDKVLICAKSTKQIVTLISRSKFLDELAYRGYSYMYITSKTGAIIDGKKVGREQFFDVLNTWGKDPEKKFVVLHHSILSEGINVKGLEAVLFMRSMDYIGISQTIGRVIRLGAASKTYGLVCVPSYSNVGITTARKVQAVVNTVFAEGQPAISVMKR